MNKLKYYLPLPVLLFCFSTLAFSQQALDPAVKNQREADELFFDAIKAGVLEDVALEEERLVRLSEKNPEIAATWYHLARLYISQSRPEKAAGAIEKAVRLDTGNIWFRQQQAEIFVYQNKYEEAARLYQALSQRGKFNDEYVFKSAMLFQKAGKYKEALHMLDQFQQHSVQVEDVLLEKQRIYLKMNDVDGAVRVAKELIDYMPEEGRYYSNLGDIYESNNQSQKAREVYETAIKKLPDDPALQYGIAQFYKQQEDLVKYHEYIRKAIRNPGFDPATQAAILRSYLDELSLDSLRKKESVTLMEEMVRMYPDDMEMTALYGQVLSRNDKPQEAAAAFKKALAADPDMFPIWQELLFVYTGTENADSLIFWSKRAMRYFPNQAIIHFLNGIGHANKKNYENALTAYNRAIDLQPEDNKLLLSDMYSSAGDAYYSLNRHKASDSCYEKALVLNPRNATVLNNYSYYLALRKEKLEQAARMSLHSLEIRPGEATFLDTYAWILYQQGKYSEARKYMQQAIQAEPDPGATLFDHMGDILFRLGDTEEAVTYWIKAKNQGSDNPHLEQKIRERKLYEE